jgi:hypothetical protein
MGFSSFKNFAYQVAILKKINPIVIDDILTSKTFNLPRQTTVYYAIIAGGGGGSDSGTGGWYVGSGGGAIIRLI